MTDWTDGYVCEIEYTQGFYRELTPSHLAFCLLLKGIRPPSLAAPLRYCELGSGQGLSANLIAAANPGAEVWATDFNPSHTANARALAAAAGSANVHFFDRSFAEFLDADLPELDVITLHGIYSWVSSENRATIVEFIRRRLKPGGIVYISYNCLPGWAPVLPLRELMVEHAAGSSEGMTARIDKAIAFAGQLAELKSGYFAVNPGVAARVEKLQGMSRNYLAHEYFNRDWTPQYFSRIARELAVAKLGFAASANPADTIDVLNLSEEAQALLAGIGDETLRQTARDYVLNQQFRKDIFVRGAVRLSGQEQTEMLLGTRFALIVPREAVPRKAAYPAGELTLLHENYTPVLDALARGPATLGELTAMDGVRHLGFGLVLQAAIVLTSAGVLAPCLPAAGDADRARTVASFNSAVLERARFQGGLMFLASPVTGGGVELGSLDQLLLLAARQNADPAAFALPILMARGEGLVKDGQALATVEENLAEMQIRTEAFRTRTLPLLRYLGVA